MRDCKFVVKLKRVHEMVSTIVLIMEYADCGNLGDLITLGYTFTEIDIRTIAKQLLQALAQFSERDIFHRDIKPENVLVFKGNESASGKNRFQDMIKIGDFGFATQISKLNQCIQSSNMA
jgi:protein kinase